MTTPRPTLCADGYLLTWIGDYAYCTEHFYYWPRGVPSIGLIALGDTCDGLLAHVITLTARVKQLEDQFIDLSVEKHGVEIARDEARATLRALVDSVDNPPFHSLTVLETAAAKLAEWEGQG